MKRLVIALGILFLCGVAWADDSGFALRYNPYSNQWTYEAPDTTLQYNPNAPSPGQWTYERPGTETQYNPYSGQFEYPHTQSLDPSFFPERLPK